MLGDPWINLAADPGNGSLLNAYELCDAVEQNSYKASNGIELSNFVTPRWFITGAKGPYDHLGRCKTPLEIWPGGYASTPAAPGTRCTGTRVRGTSAAPSAARAWNGAGSTPPFGSADRKRPALNLNGRSVNAALVALAGIIIPGVAVALVVIVDHVHFLSAVTLVVG